MMESDRARIAPNPAEEARRDGFVTRRERRIRAARQVRSEAVKIGIADAAPARRTR
jgi:hypothetical protein